jgi:hypothetical protein
MKPYRNIAVMSALALAISGCSGFLDRGSSREIVHPVLKEKIERIADNRIGTYGDNPYPLLKTFDMYKTIGSIEGMVKVLKLMPEDNDHYMGLCQKLDIFLEEHPEQTNHPALENLLKDNKIALK